MQNIDGVLGFTLTGGAKGLTGIPSYTNFLNTFIVVAISLFLIHTMMKSRHGRAILSIRDNEIAAESCGVNTTYYKTLAFVASAFFAGVAGSLYAGCISVMAPAKFGFMKSIETWLWSFSAAWAPCSAPSSPRPSSRSCPRPCAPSPTTAWSSTQSC